MKGIVVEPGAYEKAAAAIAKGALVTLTSDAARENNAAIEAGRLLPTCCARR